MEDEEILETLRYIWNNTYWIIEDKVVSSKRWTWNGLKNEPNTCLNSNEKM